MNYHLLHIHAASKCTSCSTFALVATFCTTCHTFSNIVYHLLHILCTVYHLLLIQLHCLPLVALLTTLWQKQVYYLPLAWYLGTYRCNRYCNITVCLLKFWNIKCFTNMRYMMQFYIYSLLVYSRDLISWYKLWLMCGQRKMTM